MMRKLLWISILLGVALRVWGIDYGLPHTAARPDEQGIISKALRFGTGDLNPHYFVHPTLYIYFLFLLFTVYFVTGLAVGRFDGTEEFVFEYLTSPEIFYLLGRAVSVLLGIVTIVLVYLLGKRAYSERVGTLAAFFVAVSPLYVIESHFVLTDVPMTVLLLLSYIFVYRIFTIGQTKDYLAAGILAGMATSVKYNAGVLPISIVLAHYLRWREKEEFLAISKKRDLWISLVAVCIAFVVFSPFIVLDFSTFRRDLLDQVFVLRAGRIDLTTLNIGNSYIYHMLYSFRYSLGVLLYAVALAGVALAAFRRTPADLLLLSFPFFYFAVVGNIKLPFYRYIFAVIPFLCIAASLVIDWLSDRLSRYTATFVPASLALILAVEPLYASVMHDYLLSKADTRLLAAGWITKNIPPGSKIALVGSFWSIPQLPKSREWIENELATVSAMKVNRANYDSLLLTLPYLLNRLGTGEQALGYEPYRAVRKSLADADDYTKRFFIDGDDLGHVRRKAIEYVIVSEHPFLALYNSQLKIAEFTKSLGTLVIEFAPMKTLAAPVFDPLDAYYIPVSGFNGVSRPGPFIRIYKIG